MRRSPRAWLGVYVLTGVVAGAVSDLGGASQNLSVFRSAALALTAGTPMYERFSWDFDFYKYGPSFAFGFLPFAVLPWHVAAIAWSVLNFALGAVGLARLVRTTWAHEPEPAREAKVSLALGLAWPGIVLTTDGDQSNLLVVGISLLACAAFLERRPRVAAPWLAFAILMKLFPAAFGALALIERKWLRAVGWLCAWIAVFAVLPATLVGPARLWRYYAEWRGMLVGDHGGAQASWSHWSIMHALDMTFGASPARDSLVQGLGVLVLLASAAVFVVRARPKPEPERRVLGFTFAAATLAFVLLFNHRSESPTYVLSAVAASMYVLTVRQRRAWHWALFVLVVLAPSPLYSDYRTPGLVGALAAKRLFHPLRVVPLAVLWAVLTARLVGVSDSRVV